MGKMEAAQQLRKRAQAAGKMGCLLGILLNQIDVIGFASHLTENAQGTIYRGDDKNDTTSPAKESIKTNVLTPIP